MSSHQWIAVAALAAAAGVGLGAFGAHGLEERFAETENGLANWETGVRYHVWHALALAIFGLCAERFSLPNFIGWCFLIGIVFFSGSLYLLSLEIGAGVVWPFTPLGGTLFLLGWLRFAQEMMRAND